MTTQDLLLLAVVIMNTVLAFLVWGSNKKDPVNLWFSVFAGSLALWAGSLIIFRTASGKDIAIFFLKISYLAAVFIASSLYIFMHYFPTEEPITKKKKVFLIASTVFLVAFFMLPNILISDITDQGGVKAGLQEPIGYSVFAVYFISYFFGSLDSLYKKWRKSQGETKTNIGYIIWSILTAGLFGVYFNLILPSPFVSDWLYTWLGPIFTAIIVIAVCYAITRHHLLNVKVIAAEMLSSAIVFILFLEIVFSKTTTESILRFIFFLITGFFSSYLVRSVRREVKQKEELENLTMKLEHANAELKKLDQAKSEFISLASHQLLTPLTAIKGYSSMILEGSYGKIEEKLDRVMHMIFSSSNQLVSLVLDLLNLSRIEAGKIHYDFQKLNLGEIVAGVVEEVKDAAAKKSIGIKFENELKDGGVVSGDKEKLHEVAMNLLDNAVKYSDHGEIIVGLKNTVSGNGKSLIFSVKDNGMGIAPDEIGRLFTKFTRSEEARKIRPDGMGIGLYFVKKVVEDHHGRAWVESPGLGQGSTFFVELPADLS